MITVIDRAVTKNFRADHQPQLDYMSKAGWELVGLTPTTLAGTTVSFIYVVKTGLKCPPITGLRCPLIDTRNVR